MVVNMGFTTNGYKANTFAVVTLCASRVRCTYVSDKAQLKNTEVI